MAAGLAANAPSSSRVKPAENVPVQREEKPRAQSLHKQRNTGYSSLVMGSGGDPTRERGYSADPTQFNLSSMRGEPVRSSSTHSRANRKPTLMSSTSYSTKSQTSKIVTLGPSSSRASAAQQVSISSRTSAAVKSKTRTSTLKSKDPKTTSSRLTLSKKATYGNGGDQMSDLLKLTDKVGVASTRHVADDYLSKLQGQRSKDVYVYKPTTEVNSPKYAQTAILSDIINMTNMQREMVSDKPKKLKVTYKPPAE